MSYLTYTQPVKGAHPRIFISDTNGPTVASIVARTAAGSSWRSWWDLLASWCSSNVGAANSVFNNYGVKAAAIAFYYLMTKSGTYGSKSASIGTYLAGLGGQGETPDRENIFGLSCIYDWAYDYLTTSQRQTIRAAIASLCASYYQPADMERIYGHSEVNCLMAMFGFAAILNDSDNSSDNTTWRTRFEVSLDGWEDGTNDSFSAPHSYCGDADGGTYKGSGPISYSQTGLDFRPKFVEAMHSALNLDIYAQNPWYAKIAEWMFWHLGRKDTIGHREGEQRDFSNFNTMTQAYLMEVANHEDNWLGRGAQWLSNEQARVNYNALWGPFHIYRMLWYNPSRGATIPTLATANAGNQCKWFARIRKACFRTGFDWNTDTSFNIYASPFWGGHSQRGPGHWSLESRGETLFVRHGHYDPAQTTTYWDQAASSTTNTGHRYTYYAQQLPCNCLRIYDSNEPSENRLTSSQRYISASTYFGIKKTTGEWISNQGGCIWPKATDHAFPYSLTDFLATPSWTAETVALAPVENSKFSYVVFNLNNSYYSGKQTRYKLHVMWIKPRQINTSWNDPLILLWYDCTSHIDSDSSKGGRKTQTIQLQTQAQMSGSASLLQISRTNAKCWVKTYTPAVLAEFVSGYKDLDGNTYVPTSTSARDDSIYPSGSSPWRTEIYPQVASTNPGFLLALAPAAITANVSDVPFGTLVNDATWRGIQFGNNIFKMRKGDTHEAVFEDVSIPIPEPSPPTAPYGLVAQAYDSNVNTVWYQTELAMDHWHIWRRTKIGVGLYTAWAQIGSNTLKQYNDGTVINNTTYQYAVTAIDSDAEESVYSSFSEEVTPQAAVPVPTPPPPIVVPPALNNKRRSAGTSFSMSVLPCPDRTVDRPDIPQAAWMYAGFAVAAPAIDYSAGSEIPNPAGVGGEAISCPTTADGSALSCACVAEEGEPL